MPEPSQWVQITQANPNHSAAYINRFRQMEAQGRDLGGEARLIDAMVGRNAHILDAGCGPGRVSGRLAAMGHRVVGVDVDPILIEAAEADHPGPRYFTGDLAELDLASKGITEGFEAIVSAGNVMTFLAPSTRIEVLRRLGQHLADNGRIVIGFGVGRGYEYREFLADVETAGLEPDVLLGTWDLRAFTTNSDFLVAILRAQ